MTWITCLFSDLLKLTLFCDSVIFSLFKGSRKVSGPLHGYILWECLLSNSQPALLTLFHGLHFCQKKRKKYKQPKPQTKSQMWKKKLQWPFFHDVLFHKLIMKIVKSWEGVHLSWKCSHRNSYACTVGVSCPVKNTSTWHSFGCFCGIILH